ncbi:DUF4230 domain-containing protein [Planctomycetota bacterium]|nr:DUF4230 domain-containing protein [Planctomycetota bacterium]
MNDQVNDKPVEAEVEQGDRVVAEGGGEVVEKRRGGFRRFMMGMMILAVLILGVGGYGVFKVLGKASEFVYSTTASKTVTGIIDNLRGQSKYVVYLHTVDVIIEKEQVTKFIGEIFSTTSTARVKYFKNKVEWWVDFSELSDGDIEIDDEGKKILVRINEPEINLEMVVIQTDPDLIQVEMDRGWVSWPGTPKQLAEEARREIRATIVDQAKVEENMEIARIRAKESVTRLLEALMGTSHEGYEIEVEVREEDESK